MTPLLLVVLLHGCAGRRIPDHLRLDDPALSTAPTALETPADAVGALLGPDPLARSPRLVPPETLPEGSDALEAYIQAIRALERGDGDVAGTLQQVEDAWRGTAAVALSRGYRLRAAESRLANPDTADDAAQAEVLLLLTPLRATTSEVVPPLPPLDWLGRSADARDAALRYGDRWVLGAWLDGPDIALEGVSAAMDGPAFDRLRDDPAGRLIRARAAGTAGDATPGLAALTRATRLALTRAAADRDKEQAAWSDMEKAAAEELGADDPIVALLDQATASLTDAAADDLAAGGARLAIEARRWAAPCPEGQTCAALDRVDGMAAASRFHPDIATLARVWQVIALKESLDTMDVGHDTVLFPRAAVAVVDALIGTGGGPLSATLVRTKRPDAGVWLELGRAVGANATTDWPSVQAALDAHLEREATAAAAALDDAEMTALLERIARRGTR